MVTNITIIFEKNNTPEQKNALRGIKTIDFRQMVTSGPGISVTDSLLAEMGYPNPTPGQMYILYDVSEEAVEPELIDRPWAIKPFVQDKNGTPQTVLYTNLFDDTEWSGKGIAF